MNDLQTRRAFLRAAAAASAAWAAADLVQVEEALAWAAQQAGQGRPEFTVLTADQADVVDALTSRILPSVDGRPGAHEAGVVLLHRPGARDVQRRPEEALRRRRRRSEPARRAQVEGRGGLRRADAGAAGRAAARHREDAVLPGRALRHDRRHLRAADVGRQPRLRRLAHARLRASAAVPGAVRLLRRRRQPEEADVRAGRSQGVAFPAQRHRRLRDRRIRRRRRHPRQGARRRPASRSSCSSRGRGSPRRSSITTSSARSCRARTRNNPATQPQTFRATPTDKAQKALHAHLRPAGRRQQRALHRQLLAAPSERLQRGQRARRRARHGARRLADHLRRARAVLHEGRVGARRVGRAGAVRSAAVAAVSDAAAAGEIVRRAARAGRASARAAPAAVADGDQLAVLQRPARVPALRLLPVLHVRVPREVDVDGDDAAAGGGDRPLRDPAGQLRGARRDGARRPRDRAWPTSTRSKRLQLQRAKAVVLCANGAETPRLLLNSESSRFPQRPGQLERRRRQVPDVQHVLRRERAVRASAQRVQERPEHAHGARLLRHGSEARLLRRRRHRRALRQVPDHVRARRAAAGIADVGRRLRARSRRAVHAHDVLRHARHVAAARDQQRHARSRRSRTRGACRACASPTRIIRTI